MDLRTEAKLAKPNHKEVSHGQPEDKYLTEQIDDLRLFLRLVRQGVVGYGTCRKCGLHADRKLLICGNCMMEKRAKVYPFFFGTPEDLDHMWKVTSAMFEHDRPESEIDSYVHRFSESFRP